MVILIDLMLAFMAGLLLASRASSNITAPSPFPASSHGDGPTSELNALLALYTSAHGQYWRWTGVPWDFSELSPDPCAEHWQGLTCETICDGTVCADAIVKIELSSMDLWGSLPEQLGDFPALVNLTISANAYLSSSTIPSSIAKLSNLTWLSLSGNYLGGSIPEGISGLTALTVLDLAVNHLTGPIPDDIGRLDHLDMLLLGENALNSTIPSSIGQLSALTQCDLSSNQLRGHIPGTVSLLISLNTLYLDENWLSGLIPSELWTMSWLHELYIGSNELSGSLPADIAQLTHLRYFSAKLNHFNGSIPEEIGSMPMLYWLDLSSNEISGRWPDSLGDLVALSILDLHNNAITGPIPPSIGNLSSLTSLDASSNQLSQHLPRTLNRLTQLYILDLEHNLLSGRLPDNLGEIDVVMVSFGFNSFTGPIPGSLVQYGVASFSIEHNLITGSIPAIGGLRSIERLALTHNFLTGAFPVRLDEFSNMWWFQIGLNMLTGCMDRLFVLPVDGALFSFLTFFNISNNYFTGSLSPIVNYTSALVIDASSNLLTGTIPALHTIYNLNMLFIEHNMLKGTFGGQFNSTTNYALDYVDISDNRLTGSLPNDAGQYNTLEVFLAMQNCFTGLLPVAICESPRLTMLAFDGLSSASACRQRVLPRLFPTYTLAPDAVHGSIPACYFSITHLEVLHLSGNVFSGSIPADVELGYELADLSLSHNQLTGTIPKALQGGKKWAKLDLSFNKLTGRLDGDAEAYGSDCSVSLDSNRLSGPIPAAYYDLKDVSMLRGNMFSCDSKGLANDVPAHDSYSEQYSCGSDTLNAVFITWLAVAGFIAAGIAGLLWCKQSGTVENSILIRTFEAINKLQAWREVYQAEFNEGSISLGEHQERQVVSAGRLFEAVRQFAAGITIFMVAIASPIYVCLSIYYGSYEDQYAWTDSAAYLSGQSAALALLLIFVAVFTLTFSLKQLLFPSITPLFANAHESRDEDKAVSQDDVPAAPGRWTAPWWCKATVLALVDITVVMTINICFVYVHAAVNASAGLFVSLLMGLFKLCWSAVLQFGIIRCLQSTAASSEEAVVHMDNVLYYSCLVMFNTIVAPCFAALIASSDCFYYVVTSPPSISAGFSFFTIDLAIYVHRDVSFEPPFSYSYQCSSAVLADYAYVFAFKYLIIGVFYPALVVALSFYLDHVHKDGDGVQTSMTKVLMAVVHPLWRPPSADITTQAHVPWIEAALAEMTFSGPLFSAADSIVRLTMMIATLLTFGVVLPYLAILISFAVFTNTFLTQLGLAKSLLSVVGGSGAEQKRKAMMVHACLQCSYLLQTLKLACRPLPILMVLFYGFFLVDVEGDAEDKWKAFYFLLAMLCFPLLLFIGGQLFELTMQGKRPGRYAFSALQDTEDPLLSNVVS